MSSQDITARAAPRAHRKLPAEVNILLVLIGIALVFEILGWIFQGQSFLFSWNRLKIMILQVSVIGIIAVGVTGLWARWFPELRRARTFDPPEEPLILEPDVPSSASVPIKGS